MGLTFYWIKADVRLMKASSIQISYVPQRDFIQVKLKAALANFGRGMDVAEWAQAELAPEGSPAIFFSSRTGDVTLNSVGGQLNFPFSIREKSATDLDIELARTLGSSAKVALFNPAQSPDASRRQKLIVRVQTASTGTALAQLCFEVRGEVTQEIYRGMAKEISVEECGGEE
jgi:hypothetical protein